MVVSLQKIRRQCDATSSAGALTRNEAEQGFQMGLSAATTATSATVKTHGASAITSTSPNANIEFKSVV
jgi:hypothetical protein